MDSRSAIEWTTRASHHPSYTTLRSAGKGLPRLWVPGIAYVTEAGDLQLGRSAGYNSDAPPFRRLPCGHRGRLAHWTHVAWLVPRATLNQALVAEHGIIFPEALIDCDSLPHAHRWLREQPLICVSRFTWRRLAHAGVRVYRVAFDAAGARELDVEVTGGSAAPSSLAIALDALDSAMTAAWDGRALLDIQGDPSPIDRALRLVSGGVLDETSVINALDVRALIEDGYGYRGALGGQLAAIPSLTHELGPLDALFGQIFDRARPTRAIAENLLTVLAHAAPHTSEVIVPMYGTARRSIVPALRVPDVARLCIDGETRRDLVLSAERRWSLDGVDKWNPALPPVLVARPRVVSQA